MKTNIKTAAVIGAGYMGGGIAQTLALAGVDVQLADANPELTRKALERLLAESEQFEREGLFKPGSTARLKERLRAADSIESAVASVDFVEEAVPEVPAIKRDVLSRVARAAACGDHRRKQYLHASDLGIGRGIRGRAALSGRPFLQPGSVHPGRRSDPSCRH